MDPYLSDPDPKLGSKGLVIHNTSFKIILYVQTIDRNDISSLQNFTYLLVLGKDFLCRD